VLVPALGEPMKGLLAIAIGGALGALARYGVFVAATHFLGHGFPYGTLFVNVLGSLLLGVLIEGSALAWTLPESVRLFLVVGVFGAFTTFSTFSLDVAVLYERDRTIAATSYVLASVVLSVGGLFAGLHIVRRVLMPH
jgi:CrcB protein